MVFVAGRHCVDRFETSLVDDETGKDLSPYYPVRAEYDGFLRDQKYLAKKLVAERDAGDSGQVPFPSLPEFQRLGTFKARATSRRNVIPNGYLSRDTARAACQTAGKRLCTRGEWREACRGSLGTKYPYGARYDRTVCNLGRGRHPSRILFGSPAASMVDPRLNTLSLDGQPLLRPTGASEVCRSRWGDDAVFDMVGNLDEWVDDDKGAFLGGTYSRYTAAGCDAIVTAHPPGYYDYSTGGRCCLDARTGAAESDAGAKDETAALLKRAERALAEERYPEARQLLRAAEVATPSLPRVSQLYARALDRDRNFAMRPRRIDDPSAYEAIKHLGGGSTITLRFVRDGATVGAFKPAQSRGQSDYIAEVAAWRLCELLRCGFHVPRNEPVQVRRDVFDALYSRIDDPRQKAYREQNFQDLTWTTDPAGESWLFGALEDWVPNLAELPIEHVAVYQRWLLPEALGGLPPSELDTPAIDGFTVEQARKSDVHRKKLDKQLRGMTRREFARQLSQILAFDFLIGNWDRFSTRPDYYGTNCHVADGRLVSIDNGAAFRNAPHPEAERRLQLVGRFSRQFVSALRELREETTLRRLFPEATAGERGRFFVFWRQRRLLLERVSELEARHGTSEVLAFP